MSDLTIGQKIGCTFKLGDFEFGRVDLEVSGFNPDLDFEAQQETIKVGFTKLFPQMLNMLDKEVEKYRDGTSN